VLRDALLTGDTYESLAVMSILAHEWAVAEGNECARDPGP
jgi:hypothetical protein